MLSIKIAWRYYLESLASISVAWDSSIFSNNGTCDDLMTFRSRGSKWNIRHTRPSCNSVTLTHSFSKYGMHPISSTAEELEWLPFVDARPGELAVRKTRGKETL
jgi:hypothetical protein